MGFKYQNLALRSQCHSVTGCVKVVKILLTSVWIKEGFAPQFEGNLLYTSLDVEIHCNAIRWDWGSREEMAWKINKSFYTSCAAEHGDKAEEQEGSCLQRYRSMSCNHEVTNCFKQSSTGLQQPLWSHWPKGKSSVEIIRIRPALHSHFHFQVI